MPRRRLVLAAALAVAATPVLASETYRFDPGHSTIHFTWSYAGHVTHSADFLRFDGTAVIDRDDLPASRVEVTIDADSAHTGYSLADAYLTSSGFFDSVRYPEIRFVATEVRQVAADRALITGDLTIKDITNPVALDTALAFDRPVEPGRALDAGAAERIRFRATAAVLRRDWSLGSYLPLIADRVEITIDAELLAVSDRS